MFHTLVTLSLLLQVKTMLAWLQLLTLKTIRALTVDMLMGNSFI